MAKINNNKKKGTHPGKPMMIWALSSNLSIKAS